MLGEKRTCTRTARKVPTTSAKFAVCKCTVKGRRPEETGLFCFFDVNGVFVRRRNDRARVGLVFCERNLHNMSIRARNTTNAHSQWKRIKKNKKTGQICKIIRQYLSDLRRACVMKRVYAEFDVRRRESPFLRNTMPNMRAYQIVLIG